MIKKLTAGLLLGALLVAGCGGGEKKADPKAEQKAPAKDEIVITVGNNLVAGKFDPTIGYGVWNADIFHAHLFKIGKENALVQDLAVKETISPDGKTYTYEIRKDAKFADGKPLTAKDIEFTFKKAMSRASAADLTMVAGVKAVDDTHVEFTLKQPWSTFPYLLTSVGIVPQHAYTDAYGDKPVCSGAWKVVDFQKGQQLILAPNEHYYGPKSKFKKVTILKMDEDAALAGAKSGKLDVVLVNADFAGNEVKGMKLKAYDTTDIFVINLPVIKEGVEKEKKVGNNVTCDPAIRKALNIGIDRKGIISKGLNGYGKPAYGFGVYRPWGSGTSFADNKVEEAKKILADAGWKDTNGDGIVDKNGVNAEFTITGRSNDLARYNTVVALAEEAKKLGIKIVPKSAAWAECRIARNIPTNWSFGEADPITVYRQYHSSQVDVNKIGNPSTYKNPEADALMEKAIKALNRDEANKFWQESLKRTEADVPSLVLCNPQNLYFIRDGLQIPDFGKVIPRSQGVSIVENMNEWSWK